MVRAWYKNEWERRIEEDEEFNRKFAELHKNSERAPGYKETTELTLDEWIFDRCRF